MHARIVTVLLLLAPILPGQKATERPLPIAWFSFKSRGNWVDESDPKKPRMLKPGDPVYSSSKLVRRDPKTVSDIAYLSLPDASYRDFPCSQPLVCEKPLDLYEVAQAAEPHLKTFQRVINTMSGKTRSVRRILKDAAVASSSGLPADAILTSAARAGKYTFAWCFNAMDRKCPDDPLPIAIDWDPGKPTGFIPIQKAGSGLHRLILLKQVEDEWFYTEQDAYVLIVSGANARTRLTRVSTALKALQIETQSRLYDVTARTRVAILMQLEAERSE